MKFAYFTLNIFTATTLTQTQGLLTVLGLGGLKSLHSSLAIFPVLDSVIQSSDI